MKYFYLIKKTTPLLLVFLLFSCGLRKEVVYYQDIDSLKEKENMSSYEIKIQPDDLLTINISADDPEIAMPFNINPSNPLTTTKQDTAGSVYLVDVNGSIDFPVLGKLKISGLTRSELLVLFRQKISTYIKNPIINIRLMNFKVSLQGEVNAPGTYPVASERVTLIEALSMARDLTIYGKRDNILIIRDLNGVKSYNRVDITKSDFMNSPFYYLAQNDVIYVEPNKTKVNNSVIGPDIGVVFSITALLITLVTFIISTTK